VSKLEACTSGDPNGTENIRLTESDEQLQTHLLTTLRSERVGGSMCIFSRFKFDGLFALF